MPTLNSFLSDISISKFSQSGSQFAFICFAISFISILVCLPPVWEREQDMLFCAVRPLVRLVWFEWGTECAILLGRHSVISWCGSSLFHLVSQPPKAHLTVPAERDTLVGHPWEGKRPRRGRVQMVNRPDCFCCRTPNNHLIICPRGLLIRPLKATNLLARSLLEPHSPLQKFSPACVLGYYSFFNLTPTIFHLSESHHMFWAN